MKGEENSSSKGKKSIQIGSICLILSIFLSIIFIVITYIVPYGIMHHYMLLLVIVGIILAQFVFMFILKSFSFIIQPVLLIAYFLTLFSVWMVSTRQEIAISSHITISKAKTNLPKTNKTNTVYVLGEISSNINGNSNILKTKEDFITVIKDKNKTKAGGHLDFSVDFSEFSSKAAQEKEDSSVKKLEDIIEIWIKKYKYVDLFSGGVLTIHIGVPGDIYNSMKMKEKDDKNIQPASKEGDIKEPTKVEDKAQNEADAEKNQEQAPEQAKTEEQAPSAAAV